jgi:hypothetical protein
MGIKEYTLLTNSRHSPELKGLLGPGEITTALLFIILLKFLII